MNHSEGIDLNESSHWTIGRAYCALSTVAKPRGQSLPCQRHVETLLMYYFKPTPGFRSPERNHPQVPAPARRPYLVPLPRPQPIAHETPSLDPRGRPTRPTWHSESVSDEQVAMQACYADHLNRIAMHSVFAHLRGDDPHNADSRASPAWEPEGELILTTTSDAPFL